MKRFLLVPVLGAIALILSAGTAHAQTLCSWQDIIQNSLGQGNPNATVIVLSGTIGGARAVNTTAQPGTPLATIYSDPYGASPINQTTNPVTTASGNGWFQYWTACSSYQVIQVYGPGVNGQLVYGIFVGGGSSSGGVTSVDSVAPIVTTPEPITGAGTVSCPTCVVTVTGTGPISSSGGTTPALSCPTCVVGANLPLPVTSTAATFFPATSSACTLSVYLATGTTYCTIDNLTGTVSSSSDAGALIQGVIAAKTATCGELDFKSGIYNINSSALSTTGGFTQANGISFPPQVVANQYCQWKIHGEVNVPAIDQFSTPAGTSGVIFNVTSTAISSVAAGHNIFGMFAQPDVTNGVGASIWGDNFDIRFPTNQRGSETCINMTKALNTHFVNVTCDTAVA